jgi:hypothetical protein
MLNKLPFKNISFLDIGPQSSNSYRLPLQSVPTVWTIQHFAIAFLVLGRIFCHEGYCREISFENWGSVLTVGTTSFVRK